MYMCGFDSTFMQISLDVVEEGLGTVDAAKLSIELLV